MPNEVRQDFLNLAGSPIAIVEGGKRKTVTISQAIDRQLVQLALKGNRVAVQVFKQREERYAAEMLAEIADLSDQLSKKLEKRMRESPDDVDDRLVDLVTQVKLWLKPFGLG
jgi:ribose 1,5-bisphosphokinase PhnN